MSGNDDKSEIVPKSQVIVDSDLSVTRLAFLLKLGHEEERLDYKEGFAVTKAAGKTQNIVDLVCDIVAMANTDGGYIIYGVRDNKNGTFTNIGVSPECMKLLTQENMMNWLDKYMDPKIRVLSASRNHEGNDYVLICIKKNILPIPFRIDGKYRNENEEEINKFRIGDIFARQGARSIRASYHDVIRLMEDVRRDERAKSPATLPHIVERLDILIGLLGGLPPEYRGATDNFLLGTKEEIEDRVATLIEHQQTKRLIRLLSKEFKAIVNILSDLQTADTVEYLIESLDRSFISFLENLEPLWAGTLEMDCLQCGAKLVELLHRLYVRVHKIQFPVGKDAYDGLWLQGRIVMFAYLMGALAVFQNKHDFAVKMLHRDNPFEEYYREFSWFRYTLIKMGRARRFSQKGFCAEVFELYKDDDYVASLFEGEESFKDSLCQFDFLQCAYTLVNRKNHEDCYPSFGVFYKARIEPIVHKIIETHDKGSWIPAIDEPTCKKIIGTLDQLAAKEFGFNYDWDVGGWHDRIIASFMAD